MKNFNSHPELVSGSLKQQRRFRNKFGMTMLLTSIFLLLSSVTLAQFTKIVAADTIAASGTNGVGADMDFNRLTGILFPATMTSDTVFIQTADTLKGESFVDAYYTQSTGTQIRMHVVVQAGKQVGFPPLWAEQLRRHVRIVADDAEAAKRIIQLLGY